MKANEIKDSLLKHYYPRGRHICTTNFTGCGMDEADVVMVTEKGIVYEYEVKCSYSDFKADFKKKYKHDKLSGLMGPAYLNKYLNNDVWKDKWFPIPNHFYYACVQNLIPLDKIPVYAGLVYIGPAGEVTVVKKAPKLHNNRAPVGFILQICRSLSARMIFGSSYMNYKNNLNLTSLVLTP